MRGVIFGQQVDTFVCSSTLIAPDVILLAAHCLDDAAFTFGMGEVEDKELFWTRQADLTTWDGSQRNPDLPADAIAVQDFVIHDGFSMENFDIGISQNDDIALLQEISRTRITLSSFLGALLSPDAGQADIAFYCINPPNRRRTPPLRPRLAPPNPPL